MSESFMEREERLSEACAVISRDFKGCLYHLL